MKYSRFSCGSAGKRAASYGTFASTGRDGAPEIVDLLLQVGLAFA